MGKLVLATGIVLMQHGHATVKVTVPMGCHSEAYDADSGKELVSGWKVNWFWIYSKHPVRAAVWSVRCP